MRIALVLALLLPAACASPRLVGPQEDGLGLAPAFVAQPRAQPRVQPRVQPRAQPLPPSVQVLAQRVTPTPRVERRKVEPALRVPSTRVQSASPVRVAVRSPRPVFDARSLFRSTIADGTKSGGDCAT